MTDKATLTKSIDTLVKEIDAFREPYKNTDRGMTPEDLVKFENMLAELDNREKELALVEKSEAISAKLTKTVEIPHGSDTKTSAPAETAEKHRELIKTYFSKGDKSPEFTSQYLEFKSLVAKGLVADVDSQGGYLVLPEILVNRLIKFVDNETFMRGLATVWPVAGAASMGAPSLDTDVDDADWTTEIAEATADTAMRFGKRELRPHPLSKLVKVSNTLLRQAILDPEELVLGRLGYKFAISQENAFLNGSGAGRPLGVFVASAQGISTGRDVTSSSTTTFSADNLIETLYNLKPQYIRNATWILHRDVLKSIRKLKDGNGQFLWNPGIAGGQPGTILDRPFVSSEYAPNTFTTGLYMAVIGDFSNYWIADGMDVSVRRLNELYATSDQTGFLGRAEVDGMPVLEEAFSRLKLG